MGFVRLALAGTVLQMSLSLSTGFAGEAVELSALKNGQRVTLLCDERTLTGEIVNNAPDFICLKVEADTWSEVPKGETILVFKSRIRRALLEKMP